MLAALMMVNWQETFRRRRTPAVSVTIAASIPQGAAFIGLGAGFWHITGLPESCSSPAGFVGLFVHSAGWRRLERDQDPS